MGIISKEEEYRLFEEYEKSPTIALRNEIISHNLISIEVLAKEFHKKNDYKLDYDDLYQDCVMTLMNCVDKYKISNGNNIRFYSYYKLACIRGMYKNVYLGDVIKQNSKLHQEGNYKKTYSFTQLSDEKLDEYNGSYVLHDDKNNLVFEEIINEIIDDSLTDLERKVMIDLLGLFGHDKLKTYEIGKKYKLRDPKRVIRVSRAKLNEYYRKNIHRLDDLRDELIRHNFKNR